MYKVFVNYGYAHEQEDSSHDDLGIALNYFHSYVDNWASEGEVVELISFAKDGEAIFHEVCYC